MCFDMGYLRYEIMKISGRKCFCRLQGGSYEFKIAFWNEYRKILEKVTSWNKFFKQIKEKHSIYKKLICISGEWRMKEEMRGRGKKEEKKGGSLKKRENRNVYLVIDISVS